jgi:amidase
MIHAQDLRRPSRPVRNFRLTGIVIPALLAGCANATFARDPVPTEPSIVEVQRPLAAGRFDVRTLERHYETRIKAIDRAGPRLNSVIEINPDAGNIAAALAAGTDHGQPLFGVPILLKDNIDTGDGMQTTAGSLALVRFKPPRDASRSTTTRTRARDADFCAGIILSMPKPRAR